MTDAFANGPAITIDGVSLDFEDRPLFDNLSFSIGAGKCTCILGPSGCGKSTLLRMISGNPDIAYDGRITFSSPGSQVSWMSQNDLLLPWLSLQDNVMLGAKLRGEVNDAVRRKAGKLIARAGLAGYENGLPATLSGGMRQRGALLRTLMEERDLLLMDEPFSALDALTRIRLQNLAAGMTRGRTVVLVTHDPMEALRLADEILVFSGRPAAVERITDLPGEPPRRPGDPQMTPYYRDLLAMLMEEKV